MIPFTVIVSHHAWERFVTRYELYRPEPPDCYMKEFGRLLLAAKPAKLGCGEVFRMLDNGLEGAAYYEVEGWRFILSEDSSRMITVERIIVGTPKKRGKRRRKNYE